MNDKDNTILRKRKRQIDRRLRRKQYANRERPMLAASNVHYEMADRARAIDCGAVGAFHMLARRVGLVAAIDRRLHVLKQHKPYHESDHVLNIAYNTLGGGTCLDDIESHRSDGAYMDALGAERIPDPTTTGDFLRRFSAHDVIALMEAINAIRPKVWSKRLTRQQLNQAVIDLDGTIAPTTGRCKQGMGLAYNGVWGYHPLIVSLANTNEPLYLVNRPGNRPSHEGAAQWADRGVALARRSFRGVCLRGDTDFSLTGNFDRWSEDGVQFAFGYDARENLVRIAEGMEQGAWTPLKRRARYDRKGPRRARPDNIKEDIVVQRGYKNIRTEGEQVTEFTYRPTKCKRTYRMIVLKKDLSVSCGQQQMFEEIRYFFYITNIEDMSPTELVHFYRQRCNQENLIEQLKNGLNALRMPTGGLVSNWAYMVMASLAWTLKAWFALQARCREERVELLKMEFRRFLRQIVRIPCQIIRTGRRIVFRILGYNEWTRTFLSTHGRIRELRFT